MTTIEKEAKRTAIRELLEVKSPEDSVSYLNILLYGDPGSGKTWLAGTADDSPNTAPVLLLDVEGGTTTLRHKPGIDVMQIRSMRQIEQAHAAVSKNPGHYKTVIIDSITELQKLDMRTLMLEQVEKRPDSTDVYVPSQREWGKSGERVRMIIRGFRDLDCNVIVTALVAEKIDEKTNITYMFPSLPGKLRGEIPGFFDIVGLLTANDERVGDETVITRKCQFAKTTRVIAKDRTNALPQVMESPTIPEMWRLIEASSTKSKAS